MLKFQQKNYHSRLKRDEKEYFPSSSRKMEEKEDKSPIDIEDWQKTHNKKVSKTSLKEYQEIVIE